MEKYNEQEFYFWISANGENYRCDPDNTLAFLHEDKKYDHIFYIIDHEENTFNGIYVFRQEHPKFDELIYKMIQTGYSVENQELQDCDVEAYNRRFPTLDTHKLTPREKTRVKWLGYLLAKDLLTPDDFKKKRKSIL